MKIVAVGFKVSQENSVYYNKVTIPENFTEQDVKYQMGMMLYRAKEQGAEFVSVRFI